MKPRLIQDIKPPLKKPVRISGKARRLTVGVELTFVVGGKRYKGTQHNREVIDTFLHTGDIKTLVDLEDC